MITIDSIHQRAIRAGRQFKRAESEVISVLQAVDGKRVFVKKGFSSITDYAIRVMGMSESTAAQFVYVSRKAVNIPEIKVAIDKGKLTVSQARRISSVITQENKEVLIHQACTLSQRALEREVATINPKFAVPERIKAISSDRDSYQGSWSKEVTHKLRRLQNLLSQKNNKLCDFEQAMLFSLDVALEKIDPVKKAQRSVIRKEKPKRLASRQVPEQAGPAIPACVQHGVNLRDDRQCTHKDASGRRCSNNKFLHLHHVVPQSHGGKHTVDNIVTLCGMHHRAHHQMDLPLNFLDLCEEGNSTAFGRAPL